MHSRIFTIDRTTWARGRTPERIGLLNGNTGRMCCLGFYALACGVSRESIRGLTEYHELENHAAAKLPSELVQEEWGGETITQWCQSKTHDELMSVNDDDTLDEGERESRVAALFKSIGVDVSFV